MFSFAFDTHVSVSIHRLGLGELGLVCQAFYAIVCQLISQATHRARKQETIFFTVFKKVRSLDCLCYFELYPSLITQLSCLVNCTTIWCWRSWMQHVNSVRLMLNFANRKSVWCFYWRCDKNYIKSGSLNKYEGSINQRYDLIYLRQSANPEYAQFKLVFFIYYTMQSMSTGGHTMQKLPKRSFRLCSCGLS